jgi:amino acid permease
MVSFIDIFKSLWHLHGVFIFSHHDIWFIIAVHPIRAELVKPSDMSIAVRISLLISVAIYFAIGFFGYLLFGDSIMPDVLINFDQNSDSSVGRLLDDIIRLSYALHLALVFPIMFYSLRANIDELLFTNKNKRPLALDTTRFVSLTLVLLAFTYLVAVEIPNVWYFFQFLGSTTIVCISFLFPAAIILRYSINFSPLFLSRISRFACFT